MKGLVFTEFLDLVDRTFGETTTEKMIGACPLKSGGVYTSVDTYAADELHMLVDALSGQTGLPVSELQRIYGRKLFGRFADLFPQTFVHHHGIAAFLKAVDGEIHAEVRKLYPDAEIPKITVTKCGNGNILVEYASARNLPDFCHGLLEGCVDHFRVPALVEAKGGEAGSPRRHRFEIIFR